MAALLLASAPAFAEDEVLTGWGTELTSRPAQPMIVVPPEYPKAALAKGIQAVVDVVGTVTAAGAFTQPVYRSSVDDPAFQKAVEEVLGLWMFFAAVSGENCEPKAAEAQVRVWFEIENGKAKVSVSRPPDKDKAKLAAEERAGAYVKVLTRVSPVYPNKAIQKNIRGARIVALSQVGPDGRVQKIVYQNTGADPLFYGTSQYALERWVYEIGPGMLKDRPFVCLEHTFRYRLAD
ncbi:hypothetical protein BWI17_00315 [Betaproteobacteria bacterium GR16-43]|nr:hypothetical protein BWI17_00315 [Betaproteobacteria bacterium GR16-43]